MTLNDWLQAEQELKHEINHIDRTLEIRSESEESRKIQAALVVLLSVVTLSCKRLLFQSCPGT